jgi:hypothetical protein
LVDQVLAKNSDLTVAGITLKQARLQAGLAENKQGIRTSSSVSQLITMTSVQAMVLTVGYRPVLALAMNSIYLVSSPIKQKPVVGKLLQAHRTYKQPRKVWLPPQPNYIGNWVI